MRGSHRVGYCIPFDDGAARLGVWVRRMLFGAMLIVAHFTWLFVVLWLALFLYQCLSDGGCARRQPRPWHTWQWYMRLTMRRDSSLLGLFRQPNCILVLWQVFGQ